MENPVLPSSCVTPAGTSVEVQNEWEENTHTHIGGKKCQMILVQMYNIFRLLIGVPDYSISSESYGEKQKNVENDGHLNKQL